MATFFATVFLHALLTASGAAITAEHSSLMRRDTAALNLAPSGEMIRVDGGGHGQLVPDACDDVYPLGTEGDDNCGVHQVITDDGKCEEAADAMKLTWPNNAMIEEEQYQEVHPRGCFKAPCDENVNGCIFYNGRDEAISQLNSSATRTVVPKKMTGIPVCLKHRYAHGNATANQAVACPTGYVTITDEDECRTTGDCKAYREPASFRVGMFNSTQHDLYPAGCFIHADDGLHDGFVYYNAPQTNPSSNPSGTPLCKAVEAPSKRELHKAATAAAAAANATR